MRHPVAGSAIEAAEIAKAPLINGGDGSRQHPTQALLDIYTMRKEKGHIGGQTITFLGDLKYGRTVHSLGYFMAQFGNKMIFASPEELKMPKEITDDLRAKGGRRCRNPILSMLRVFRESVFPMRNLICAAKGAILSIMSC